MAKTLNQFLEGTGILKVKSPDEQRFVDKHVAATIADRNGNGDDVFKGSKVKKVERRKERHGYETGEDAKVYEETHNNKTDSHGYDSHDTVLHKADGDHLTDHYREAPTKNVRYGQNVPSRSAQHDYHGKIGGHDINVNMSHEYHKKGDIAAAVKAAHPNVPFKVRSKVANLIHGSIYESVNEEVEGLDELSKKTLGSYVKKSAEDAEDRGRAQEYSGHESDYKAGRNRQAGIKRAVDRLTKEEAELEEKAGYSATAAKAGEDLGKPGKNFAKIARGAAAKYGSEAAGKRVAGAVLKKLRKEDHLIDLLNSVTESQAFTMVTVFNSLSEENQNMFLASCETEEGVEKMLDFSIQNRGAE